VAARKKCISQQQRNLLLTFFIPPLLLLLLLRLRLPRGPGGFGDDDRPILPVAGSGGNEFVIRAVQ